MANSVLNLSALNGINGFTLNGIDSGDGSGRSVSNAGDVNGDGLDDIIIGAARAEPNGTFSGESYVVFGNSNPSSSFNLSELNGTNGFVLNGIDVGDESGRSVSSAGDVNGDGLDDIIIGAPGAGSSGQSYLVFGSSNSSGSLNLNVLDGTNGFTLNGIDQGDGFGRSVSNAGDVNGDGLDDIIFGAANADPNGNSGAGESYVVFGNSNPNSSLNLNELDGTNGFTLNGIDAVDFSGGSVSDAGDVNGDGFDDIIIGAIFGDPNGYNSGESYVVFGNSNPSSSLNLSELDGTNGFILNGIDVEDVSGNSVSSAGDVNGDGFDDIIIGAVSAGPNGAFSGESYVVFGNSNPSSSLNLNELDGTNGFTLNGVGEFDFSGGSVSDAGDVNGDGFDDIIIGASNASPNVRYSGGSYVVFGSNNPSSNLNLDELDGTNGFTLNGIDQGDGSGGSVSSAGDVNGDGLDDIIIGARGAGSSGQSYVVFGFKTIDGTSDNDLLTGTAGRDSINGLRGIDLLIGNQGNDDLIGGGNRDQFAIAAGDGTDLITDFGGVGTGINPTQAVIDEVDTLQFFGSELTPENFLLTQNGPDLEITFEGVDETKVILQNFNLEDLDNLTTENSASVTIGNILFDGQLEIEDSFDVVNANDNRTRVFNSNTVTFLNDLNNRTSGFRNSDDVINAQGGDDKLSGLSGNDLLRGGLGKDTLRGGDGNDTLAGGNGDDSLAGGNGDDQLFGGDGEDTLQGGNGNDLTDGGNGNDTADFSNIPFEITADLNVGEAEYEVAPGVIVVDTFVSIENLTGSTLDDNLAGDPNANTLEGGEGNDTLNGRRGNDKLIGAVGNDLLRGGRGADTLTGGAGDDILFGGQGTDDLNGGTGNDVMEGRGGADLFRFESELIDGISDIDIILSFEDQDSFNFVDYLDAGGSLSFTRISGDLLQLDLNGEDKVNVFGSRSALDAAENQLEAL